MKRLSMLLASLILCVGAALAQTKVTGTVVSYEDNEPVIGATIQAVGNATVGTVTDYDGNFTLEVPEGVKTLKITYVGMEPLEVAVSTKTLKIQLKNDSQILDEVVVVAYGTQKKTSLTGSIQEVKSDAIEMRPVSSVASALEGTVSGVQVNSTYGAPGQDPSIRIRGVGTVNGSTSPLYVLDGVPFGGNISDLNPQDIESMSILKDAASAALYGNRASNGVILITTKKGKQGKLNISLDIKQGTYSRGIKEYERLGVRDWMNMEWQNMKNYAMSSSGYDIAKAEAYANENLIEDRLALNIFNKANDQLFENGKLAADAQILGTYGEDLDWYDQAVRVGYRQEYNFMANGASEKADYLISLGYLDENGYLKDSGFNRISARLSANIQPKAWFKAGLNVSGTHQNFTNTNGDSSSSYTNVFNYARNISPIYPVHLHDVTTGDYVRDAYGNLQYDPGYYTDANGVEQLTRNQYPDRHVIWENEKNSNKTVRNTMNGIAYANLILPYGFTFTLKGSLNLRHSDNTKYYSGVIGDAKGVNGRSTRANYRYKDYNFQQQLHWVREFGVHSVDALIGHENYAWNRNYLSANKYDETSEGRAQLINFNTIQSLEDYQDNYRTESYLGRVRYGYDSKYNAEVSFRRDGSSRFSRNARWGNFWSAGVNWVVSYEKFMKNVTWVDYLKLRADYGEVANDSGAGYYAYMALSSLERYDNHGAYVISQFANNDLLWETGQSWGIGLEARMFKRWNLNIDYFNRRNKNLIFDVYNPLSAGATNTEAAESTTTMNLGVISNKGLEISTDVDVFKNKDWKINLSASATYQTNKVVKLPEQNKDGIINGTKKIVEGKSMYMFYVNTWEGIDTYNGYSLYAFDDEKYYFEADGVTYGNTEGTKISGSNLNYVVAIDGVPYTYRPSTYGKKEFHGSALPDIFGSFGANVTWKSLTFNALFTYQLGGKVMDSNYQTLMSVSTNPSALHKDVLNSWTTDDATATHAIDRNGTPVVDRSLSTYTNAVSSRWLTSASYLVLKNLSLTYKLPKSLLDKADIEGATVSLSCENLFTLTKRQGLNPQQTFNGTQSNSLVTPRVFSVGLNIKF